MWSVVIVSNFDVMRALQVNVAMETVMSLIHIRDVANGHTKPSYPWWRASEPSYVNLCPPTIIKSCKSIQISHLHYRCTPGQKSTKKDRIRRPYMEVSSSELIELSRLDLRTRIWTYKMVPIDVSEFSELSRLHPVIITNQDLNV